MRVYCIRVTILTHPDYYFAGWAAVVANLEDIVSAFKARHEAFQQNFTDYLSGREEKVALLQW